MFRYFWFIFSADLQFRRAIEQPNGINTDGLGIKPSPKLKQILYSSAQCHCYTFLMNSWQLINVSDEDLEEHVRTQPLEAMNWAEYNSDFLRTDFSRTISISHLPDFFTYNHAVLRVLILFFNLTNQRICYSSIGTVCSTPSVGKASVMVLKGQ